MKNFLNQKRNTIIVYSGLLVVGFILLVISPNIFKRGLNFIPAYQAHQWDKKLKQKIIQISKNSWKDEREINIFTGDSHIELGNWYELFFGQYAVRNCGLSCAVIDDVARILLSIPDKKAKRLVLQCGINDILKRRSTADIINSYESLINKAIEKNVYEKIFVMELMPINDSWPCENVNAINSQVAELNRELLKLCDKNNTNFIDLSNEFTTVNGDLNKNLSNDGLHLNEVGYSKLAQEIQTKVLR